MSKNFIPLLIFLLKVSSMVSQSAPLKKNELPVNLQVEKRNDSVSIDSKIVNPRQKIELPTSPKTSPEIFYIVNDKAVTREEYLKYHKKKQ